MGVQKKIGNPHPPPPQWWATIFGQAGSIGRSAAADLRFNSREKGGGGGSGQVRFLVNFFNHFFHHIYALYLFANVSDVCVM